MHIRGAITVLESLTLLPASLFHSHVRSCCQHLHQASCPRGLPHHCWCCGYAWKSLAWLHWAAVWWAEEPLLSLVQSLWWTPVWLNQPMSGWCWGRELREGEEGSGGVEEKDTWTSLSAFKCRSKEDWEVWSNWSHYHLWCLKGPSCPQLWVQYTDSNSNVEPMWMLPPPASAVPSSLTIAIATCLPTCHPDFLLPAAISHSYLHL